MDRVRAVLFLALVLTVLLLILANRTTGAPKGKEKPPENPVTIRLFIAVPLFLALFYTIPFLRNRMGWGALPPSSLLSILAPVLGLVLMVGLALLGIRAIRGEGARSGRV